MKKLLLTATILSWTLVLFFSAALFINREVLPLFGLSFLIKHSGSSMFPTIEDGDLILLSENAPFEDLAVGDIVVYREAVKTYHSNYVKKGEVPPSDHESVTIDYLPNSYVIHRIVDRSETELILKGDHNESNDPYPISSDGYESKMVWLGEGMALPFQWMERYFLWLVGAAVLFLVVTVIWKNHK